ncbi:hypothetical protein SASPL_137184 [Salvia splendens]|uniref:Uncharacterized protein n=1 Tax=Salvia splendens TaxID=180675 RepID=A0A8X8WSZ6_SALSN|nr:hypothetical protein SASPL_137184 [Salvia splendens]
MGRSNPGPWVILGQTLTRVLQGPTLTGAHLGTTHSHLGSDTTSIVQGPDRLEPKMIGFIFCHLEKNVKFNNVRFVDFIYHKFFEKWQFYALVFLIINHALLGLLSRLMEFHDVTHRSILMLDWVPEFSLMQIIWHVYCIIVAVHQMVEEDSLKSPAFHARHLQALEILIGSGAEMDCLEVAAKEFAATRGADYHLVHCMALALARSGSVSYRPSILATLALALLTEVFPLQRVYDKILKFPEENRASLHDEIKDHLCSFLFKEAGAITAVFCNQYAHANEDSRSSVESLVWDYCKSVYSWHRQATLLLKGQGHYQLISDMEKIAESTFLMIVVFALGVTKHRLDTRIDQDTHLQISVKILVSLSCMEYFRRMRLPEYMDTIRAVIVNVQENESACATFIESMPSYHHLITYDGSSNQPEMEHPWSTDEVQTARVVFYMRVIPTCVDRLHASVFRNAVAPIMFLYMGHPNAKVARCTHSVFAAFVTSGKDLDQDERDLLKEQLVFYYIQRSLEGYPRITPFEGMASGVAALARNLPAGSPSTFYCVSSLIQKATSLCNAVDDLDIDLWKSWEGELEPPKKVLDLLLRLLSLVDIQVLPHLMKLLAQLIVQLPSTGQNALLNQLYQQIADSDDVIRKPALVSWVQSLSYLCSQGTDRKRPELVGESASASTTGMISLNRISARL